MDARGILNFVLLLLILALQASAASAVGLTTAGGDEGDVLADATAGGDEGDVLADATAGDERTSSFLRHLLFRGRQGRYPPRRPKTCDKYPKVCRQAGSPGRSCCKRRCVNLRWDNLNCGRCGRRCKYGETCCRSKCVNTLRDRKNCGGCSRRCKKRSYCTGGMCSYA